MADSNDSIDYDYGEQEDTVDYGYEEHAPSPRSVGSDFFVLPGAQSGLGAPPCRRSSFCPNEEAAQPQPDHTEVSGASSPSQSREVPLASSSSHHRHQHQHHGVTFSSQPSEQGYDPYYSPPASNQQKRRHNRRGGFVHGSLLRSAVMASMECPTEDDQPRPYRQNSAISLQSLQDALRETSSLASSPRKRARKVNRGSDDVEEENDADRQLHSLLTAMRVQDDQKVPAVPAMPKRDPPVRRVSRKTSYDSRISDFSDWDEEEELWESMRSSDDDNDSDSDSD